LFAWRWPLGLGLFALLVFFRIHGVSLASWNAIVKDTTPFYRYPSLGANRPIRSDEYAVSVPFVMALESGEFSGNSWGDAQAHSDPRG
jgi:hypothetical protein